MFDDNKTIKKKKKIIGDSNSSSSNIHDTASPSAQLRSSLTSNITTTTTSSGYQHPSPSGKRDFTSYTTSRSMTLGHGGHVHDVSVNPRTELQKLQDTSAKRIATLDYLRRTHEGTVHWLNTLHLSTSDLHTLPSFASAPKQARRAQNHLILGISLPTLLDPYASSAPDYLRALNDVLNDYETYQTLHPPDGHNSNSLGRTRLPSMFKRSGNNSGAGGRPRRTNTGSSNGGGGGNEALSPTHPSSSSLSTSQSYSHDDTPHRSFSNTYSSSFSPVNSSDPTETYTHLLTPHIPFSPSATETFATLAEVLIDVYLTISRLVTTPEQCSPGVQNAFASADKRVRRLLVEGFVREVGEGVREGVRGELGGVGRVVLGGLV